jgi:hypothetical protein
MQAHLIAQDVQPMIGLQQSVHASDGRAQLLSLQGQQQTCSENQMPVWLF